MAIGKVDLKALAGFKPGGSGGGGNFLKVTAPSTLRLRVLPPYKEGMTVPFLGMRLHYFDQAGENDKGLSGVCPSVDGDACLACDIYWAVQSLIPKADADMKEALRGIKPNDRTYANVVDRESGKILIWSMPWGVASNVAAVFTTHAEEGIDLTDPVKGKDLIIPVKTSGRSYRFGNVALAPRATKIGIPGWEDELHDLDDAARSRELTSEQVEVAIPIVLGEFYDSIMELYEDKPTAHSSAKTKAAPKKKRKSRGRKV